MNTLSSTLNNFFEFIVPITDFLWDFPTNNAWYASLPVIGKITFPVFLLLAAGVFFTIKTGFTQIVRFGTGLRILTQQKTTSIGVSSLAAFLLSTAMRVGPGNIMGVTGAISVGGPGALFWMWVSAFFGMATAFAEAVLAQIYKERKGNEFVGGLPFYGAKILGNKKWVGVALSGLFISYALLNVPPQTFHTFTALGSIFDTLAGTPYNRDSSVYFAIGIILTLSVAGATLGGVQRLTKVTDFMVPVMAVLYILTIALILAVNFEKIPGVFAAIFSEAFAPQAIFGGGFGVALMQGIKRGLMSNEAGQGTITMAAAVADAEHPCEQGFVQSIGVFLDTIIICSATGFVVIMAQVWSGDAGVQWEAIRSSKLSVYMASVEHLVPGESFDKTVKILLAFCYGLFAFTTLTGMILFAEIAANAISRSRKLIRSIRFVGGLILVPFGAACVIGGFELGNLWYIADFSNIMMVFANVPIVLIGSKLVFRALEHYNRTKGARPNASDLGVKTESWNEQ
jgi:AGCS family alanine or glycine:cation symporter